uniref:Anthranilate synthase component 2 n=1 Tax=Melanthalia intermedia TaxID=172989 RepID=A0A345UAF8_9FLOR|nr:anthranilate synthase component II [Melanthalia intermedia]AXI97444.1 anthranilate synthase component II [Melanthalia intermedia]
MILVVDNYDSFTQNLVQCVGNLGFFVKVLRNDKISLSQITQYRPSHIILSPGPGSPERLTTSLKLIHLYAENIPILGVCLGHQAIGYVYGAKIKQLSYPIHGKTSLIFHNGQDLFSDLPNPFIAARYHSLVVDSRDLPSELEITAWTQDGYIMACRHKSYKLLRGIQFHPESLWTKQGTCLIKNFIKSNSSHSFQYEK